MNSPLVQKANLSLEVEKSCVFQRTKNSIGLCISCLYKNVTAPSFTASSGWLWHFVIDMASTVWVWKVKSSQRTQKLLNLSRKSYSACDCLLLARVKRLENPPLLINTQHYSLFQIAISRLSRPYQGCLPSCELHMHSRLLTVKRTDKVESSQIAHANHTISRLRACYAISGF